MRELTKADRRAIAIARHAKIDQVTVSEIRASKHGGHATVHRIEAMRIAKKIGRCFRRASDAGNLGDAVGLDRQLEAGLDYGARDRIVTAAAANSRYRPLVGTLRITQRVLRETGMVAFGFGERGH